MVAEWILSQVVYFDIVAIGGSHQAIWAIFHHVDGHEKLHLCTLDTNLLLSIKKALWPKEGKAIFPLGIVQKNPDEHHANREMYLQV